MAKILLTSENIGFLKTQISKTLRSIKSAHLTEAIACGAGFKTHASLLDCIKGDVGHLPTLIEFDDKRVAARLEILGYFDMAAVSTDAIIRSEELPLRTYISFRSGDINANDRWFKECKSRNIPNLRIEKKKKYAKLSWDCISIDKNNEAHVQDESGDRLVKVMFLEYQRIARRIPGKSEFYGKSFVGSVDIILPDLAYEIADEFFSLLYEPLRHEIRGSPHNHRRRFSSDDRRLY